MAKKQGWKKRWKKLERVAHKRHRLIISLNGEIVLDTALNTMDFVNNGGEREIAVGVSGDAVGGEMWINGDDSVLTIALPVEITSFGKVAKPQFFRTQETVSDG